MNLKVFLWKDLQEKIVVVVDNHKNKINKKEKEC